MPKDPNIIEPIDASFDALAGAMVVNMKKSTPPTITENPAPNLPKALAESDELQIGNAVLSCAVLDDANNTRILTQNGFLTAIGRHPFAPGGSGGAIDGMAPFLRAKNLEPFISEDLKRSTNAIAYVPKAKMSGLGGIGYGYRASLLADVCWVYHDAMMAGKLLKSQLHIGEACTKLLRSLTNQAIDDMVDNATGLSQSLTVEDLEDGAEYDFTIRGVWKTGIDPRLTVGGGAIWPGSSVMKGLQSIRLITPAPKKARPLEVGEKVHVKGHEPASFQVRAIHGSWVWIDWYNDQGPSYQMNDLYRPSGEPIEESK